MSLGKGPICWSELQCLWRLPENTLTLSGSEATYAPGPIGLCIPAFLKSRRLHVWLPMHLTRGAGGDLPLWDADGLAEPPLLGATRNKTGSVDNHKAWRDSQELGRGWGTRATRWMRLKDVILSGKSQSRKTPDAMIPFREKLRTDPSQRQEVTSWMVKARRRLGGGAGWRVAADGCENVLKSDSHRGLGCVSLIPGHLVFCLFASLVNVIFPSIILFAVCI